MNVEEIPLSFDCEGSTLIGVLHLPEVAQHVGVLTVVAGGPQYRAGVGRQLVTLGRELAAGGVPVLRFDHRGLGDSVGDFQGFEHIEKDLQAAIKAFKGKIPTLESIVLWGGCDAASAVMIHACKCPEVSGMILGNPFVSSAQTKAAVIRQHYFRRIFERTFWVKLIALKYNPFVYIADAIKAAFARARINNDSSADRDDQHLPFQRRMLAGLQKFEGDVLLLMSGKSLVSREFDELMQREPEWKLALEECSYQRVDLEDADQAFSTERARESITIAAREWLMVEASKGT